VTNLTNKLYATGALNFVSGFGTLERSVAPPRQWGVRIRKNF
jgi:outer membrane receptor protein involved in Fe transport